MAALLALAAAPAGAARTARPAAPVIFTVDGLFLGRGTLYASLCRADEFLTTRCFQNQQQAVNGTDPVTFRFAVVEPGRYAVQVMHDVNGNRRLDRDPWGAPAEPTGLSGRRTAGVPRFADSAFRHGSTPTTFRITLE